MEEKNVTDERVRRSGLPLPWNEAREVSFDSVVPSQPGAGDHPPLTRKQLRERERAAQQGASKRNKTQPATAQLEVLRAPAAQPVEAASVAVFDGLFTPRSQAAAVAPQPNAPQPNAPQPNAPQVIPPQPNAPQSTAEQPVAQQPTVANVVTNPVIEPEALPSRRTRRAYGAANISVLDEASVAVPVEPPARAVAAPRPRKPRGSTVKSQRIRVSRSAMASSGPPRRRGKALASKALSAAAMLFAGALLVGVSVPSNAFLDAEDVALTVSTQDGEAPQLAADSRPSQSLAVSDEVVSDVDERDGVKVISYAEVLALQYAGVSYQYRATAGALRWPFPYEVAITDGFGDRIGGFHKGTDFAAPSGTPIYAIADGVVTLIQADYSGYGYHAIISHTINGQQVESLYAHMITDSSALAVGDQIKVGDFIGLVGETGIAYGAHLHFEVHLDDVPVDPFAWLTANAVN